VISVPKLLLVVAAQGAFGIEQPVLRLVVSESGAPLCIRVIPEICHPPATAFMSLLFILPLGMLHR